jgi:hypothetical protein
MFAFPLPDWYEQIRAAPLLAISTQRSAKSFAAVPPVNLLATAGNVSAYPLGPTVGPVLKGHGRKAVVVRLAHLTAFVLAFCCKEESA